MPQLKPDALYGCEECRLAGAAFNDHKSTGYHEAAIHSKHLDLEPTTMPVLALLPSREQTTVADPMTVYAKTQRERQVSPR